MKAPALGTRKQIIMPIRVRGMARNAPGSSHNMLQKASATSDAYGNPSGRTANVASDASGESVYTSFQTFDSLGTPLTVTADNKSRLFGSANPPLTATITAGSVRG